MSVLSIYSNYRNSLPSSGTTTSVWPASNTDIADANATTIQIGGTNRTLNTKNGYTTSSQGRLSVVVSSPIRLRLELWGAGGGGSDNSNPTYGSAGGYICGDLVLPNGNYWLITGQGGRAAHQTTSFPDGGQGSSAYNGGSSGGGGSTRFGPQSNLVNSSSPATDSGLNASTAVYYLIAPGGGGGTDYGINYTVAARGGYGAGGGFASGDGRFAYDSGENANSPGCGAGQSYGGLTGTHGRQAAGDNGSKYQGGGGTGGGGGGGYYGGAGARGYYAQGSGGSAYYDPDYVRNVMCIAGGHESGVNQDYWQSSFGLRGKPSTACGNGGQNNLSNGNDGGARFSLWVP